jgi:hypothetical protein
MIVVLSKFDLGSADSKRVIRSIIEDLAGKYQHKEQSLSGRAIKIIVNVPLINTAIDLTADQRIKVGVASFLRLLLCSRFPQATLVSDLNLHRSRLLRAMEKRQ